MPSTISNGLYDIGCYIMQSSINLVAVLIVGAGAGGAKSKYSALADE